MKHRILTMVMVLAACGSGEETTYNTTATSTTSSTTTSSTTTSSTTTVTETGLTSMTSYSLSFDGIDDYVQLTQTVDYSDDYTIEFWFVPVDVNGWDMVIGHDLNNTGTFSVCGNEGCDGWKGDDYAFKWDNGSRIDSTIGIAIDTWHHIAGVQEGSQATLFVNGVVAGQGDSQQLGLIGPPVLGDEGPGLGHAYEGLISIFRVSSSAKYKSEFVPSSSLELEDDTVVLLTLDEGIGTSAQDSSASANDGTISGATWVEGGPESNGK